MVTVWQKILLFLFAFISKALQELSAFMVVNGHPIKNRQKLLRNLRVSRPDIFFYVHVITCSISVYDFKWLFHKES